MPTLDTLPASEFVKLVLIGASGAGKTGALASLVKAGYKLRILDFDNGLDSLVSQVKELCPDRLSSIGYEQFRDKYISSPVGPIISGMPTAYVRAVKRLDKWEDGTIPQDWGRGYILVIDSFTNVSKAALEWVKSMNSGYKNQQLWYPPTYSALENLLFLVTSPSFNTNVIILSHIQVDTDNDGNITSNTVSAVGKAFGPRIPSFFNNFYLLDKTVVGSTIKRVIRTVPTNLLNLKNPAPAKVAATYDISTGLADIFKALS